MTEIFRVSVKWNQKCILVSIFFSILVKSGEPQYFQPLSVSNVDACQAAKIPCGGHTGSSCLGYCMNSGYSQGVCDGSCCICSNVRNGQYPSNTAYYNMGSGNSQRQAKGSSAFAVPGHQVLTLDFFGNSIFQQPQQQQQQSTDILVQSPSYHYPVQQQPQDNFIYFNGNKDYPRATAKPTPAYSVQHLNSKKLQDGGVCTTQICIDEGNAVKSQMDERADPCDDFYQFACGGFVQRHSTMAQDQTELTAFSITREKVFSQLRTLFEEPIKFSDPHPFRLVKNLYRSCMNTRLIENYGFQPLITALDEVGGWPVLDGAGWQPRPEFTWENFAVWFKEIGLPMNIFMSIVPMPDMRNVGRRYITIGEPTLGLNDQVLKRGLNEPIVNAYYGYMVHMAMLLGADRQTAMSEMLDAVNLEIGFAQCFFRQDNDRAAAFYNPMTVEQLTAKYPYVPWLQLFQRIVPSPIQITNQEVIMVSVPQYLDCFFNLLMRTEQKTMVNYAVWRAVSGAAVYLHEGARSLQQSFGSKLTGQRVRKPRWMECTETAQMNLGNAVGAMYIRKYFKDASKAHAMAMVKDIQKAFLESLSESDWMDAYTKGKAREKALEMLVHIGYPEEHKSDAKISSLYDKFDFTETNYFGNIQNLITGATSNAFSKLREPIRRNEWSTHGHNAVVNAFYQPQENSIQFPAAILQGHFFNASRPNYLNYGAIGWIIGHEITHGFDDQGHQFGKHGNHLNWWDPTTKNTYNKKKQCIIDQYSQFQSATTRLRLNGERSQGENIADNGGIKQAYQGYLYWTGRNGQEKGLPGLEYTPSQLFWISAAQNWCSVQRSEAIKHNIVTGVHSPPEFRVRGTFSNSEEFSRDFQCSPGRRMNPTSKCSVW